MPKLRTNKILEEYRRPTFSPVTDMFGAYMKSSTDLSEKLGIAAPTVRRKKHHCDRMNLGDFVLWVQTLNIPAEEAADAIYMYLKKEERRTKTNVGHQKSTSGRNGN